MGRNKNRNKQTTPETKEDVVTDTPEIITNENELAAHTEDKTIELVDIPKNDVAIISDVEFRLIVAQRDEDGRIATKIDLHFELPESDKLNADAILGTAMSELFSMMDIHKSFKSRLFNSRLKIEVALESKHVSLDLGKLTRSQMLSLKLNNGENAKVNFMDKLAILINDALKPRKSTSFLTLREDMLQAAQLKYELPQKPKGLASPYQLQKLSMANFPETSANVAVTKEGVLTETKEEVTA